MTATTFVVAVSNGVIFGPFATRTEAERFAAFATTAIDPAEVRRLCSPVVELLNWRDATANPGSGDEHPF